MNVSQLVSAAILGVRDVALPPSKTTRATAGRLSC